MNPSAYISVTLRCVILMIVVLSSTLAASAFRTSRTLEKTNRELNAVHANLNALQETLSQALNETVGAGKVRTELEASLQDCSILQKELQDAVKEGEELRKERDDNYRRIAEIKGHFAVDDSGMLAVFWQQEIEASKAKLAELKSELEKKNPELATVNAEANALHATLQKALQIGVTRTVTLPRR